MSSNMQPGESQSGPSNAGGNTGSSQDTSRKFTPALEGLTSSISKKSAKALHKQKIHDSIEHKPPAKDSLTMEFADKNGRIPKDAITFGGNHSETNTYGYLSNFWEEPMKCNYGYEWSCAEAYFQSRKAGLMKDGATFRKIHEAKNGKKAKDLGWEVKLDREKWNEVSRGMMENTIILKFQNSEVLKKKLLETGDRMLVEARDDFVWASGLTQAKTKTTPISKWTGQNRLGEVLMEIRKVFRLEAGGKSLVEAIQHVYGPNTAGTPPPIGKCTYSRPNPASGDVAANQTPVTNTKPAPIPTSNTNSNDISEKQESIADIMQSSASPSRATFSDFGSELGARLAAVSVSPELNTNTGNGFAGPCAMDAEVVEDNNTTSDAVDRPEKRGVKRKRDNDTPPPPRNHSMTITCQHCQKHSQVQLSVDKGMAFSSRQAVEQGGLGGK